MNKRSSIILLSFLAVVSFAMVAWTSHKFSDFDDTYVLNELIKNGQKKPLHFVDSLDPQKVKMGEDLVLKGWTLKNGKKTKLISKYFVCTDCHNIENEEEDLLNPSPEGRLKYAVKHDLPFLQATTFFGIVNRRTWYNDDYVVKYGDWVKPARDTLENATQLCAIVCSQGRRLEDWEMTAILSYYQTLGYQMKDLNFSDEEKSTLINPSIGQQEKNNLIESKYLGYSPATFMDVTPKENREYGKNGDPDNGKLIYDKSCKHCHEYTNEATSLKLDDSKVTFKLFKNRLKKDNNFSLYNIVRKGTYADAGMRAYMPHYTKERMSEQQLEDLVSYVKLKAK